VHRRGLRGARLAAGHGPGGGAGARLTCPGAAREAATCGYRRRLCPLLGPRLCLPSPHLPTVATDRSTSVGHEREERGGMYDFTGRRALVTGGSRGIGAAVVRQLLDGGADVLAVARTTAYAPPQGARFATTDLRTTEGVRALADTADRELGGVDVIVHAAGGAQANESGSTLGLTDGDWQDVLDLNLLAAVRLDALLAPGMRDRGVGAIVHVSTAALVPPVPPFAHYQAAKAGLESYSRSLA